MSTSNAMSEHRRRPALLPLAGLVIALAAFAVFARAVTIIHRWNEWHHVYIGIGVALFACVMCVATSVRWRSVTGLLLLVLGAWIAWDDALAHHRQAADPQFPRTGPRGHLDYDYSWWHRLAHRRGVI